MKYFYDYQKKYYKDKSRFRIINKSRQIGISEIAAFKGVQECLKLNQDILFVSSSQRQSNLLMQKIEKYIDIYADEFMLKTGLRYKLIKDSATQKTFQNDKSIYCLPSNPETIRSFAGNVVIDEYAFHKEDRKIYSSLLPVITRGFSISIISTPLGQSNMFYSIYTDLNTYKDYKRNSIDIYEAKRQGFNIDIDSIKNNIDDETFRQEYLCEFIDESTSYFTYELLKNCTAEYIPETLKGKTYIGVDIGRSSDRTAIAVITEAYGIYYLKKLEVLDNINFQRQKEIISDIIKESEAEIVLIDKGAIGMQLAEELERDFFNVTGVNFTINLKNELVTNCKKLMEQNKIKYGDIRELISDFHKIKKNITSNNNVNFDSKRDSTGHSDRAWAFMLGLHAVKSEVEYNIYQV